ncbi:MAG: alkaline phosphatase family protein, partial [Cyanobacteria bacterium P01_A01_bin.135]
EKHGKNPVLFNDTGMWWRKKYVSWIKQALKQSVSGHKAIAKELLDKGPWDLFLMGFGETHTVGHDLYNYSQPDHPLYPHLTDNGKAPDPVLETYEDIDKAIGEIIAEADEDTYVMCFSVHGMGPNFADMLSMAFLPEFLYRFSFPGKVALSSGEVGSPPPSMVTKPIRNAWPGQIWGEMNEPNPIRRFWRTWTHKKLLRGKKHGLWSPYALTQPPIQKDIDLGWMPAIWYSDLWPEMKAFAIPGYTNGHIRINLKGRESSGIVEPADYDSLCEQIIDMVYKLTDARTGKPIAKQVVRTRQHASEDDPKLPDADIVVIWNEAVTDVVDSPDLGRVGPLTHARAGSHLGEGFMVLAGPDIPAGYEFEDMQAMDLAPTILSLMDAPLPDYLDGHSVLPSKVLS